MANCYSDDESSSYGSMPPLEDTCSAIGQREVDESTDSVSMPSLEDDPPPSASTGRGKSPDKRKTSKGVPVSSGTAPSAESPTSTSTDPPSAATVTPFASGKAPPESGGSNAAFSFSAGTAASASASPSPSSTPAAETTSTRTPAPYQFPSPVSTIVTNNSIAVTPVFSTGSNNPRLDAAVAAAIASTSGKSVSVAPPSLTAPFSGSGAGTTTTAAAGGGGFGRRRRNRARGGRRSVPAANKPVPLQFGTPTADAAAAATATGTAMASSPPLSPAFFAASSSKPEAASSYALSENAAASAAVSGGAKSSSGAVGSSSEDAKEPPSSTSGSGFATDVDIQEVLEEIRSAERASEAKAANGEFKRSVTGNLASEAGDLVCVMDDTDDVPCQCLQCRIARIEDSPAGDAFVSSPGRNNGPPRRIVHARRPPNANGNNNGTNDASTSANSTNANGRDSTPSATSPSAATAAGPTGQTIRGVRGNLGRVPRRVVPVNNTSDEASASNQASDDESESTDANPDTNAFDALAEDSSSEGSATNDSVSENSSVDSFDSEDAIDRYSQDDISDSDSSDGSSDGMMGFHSMLDAMGNFALRMSRDSPSRPSSEIKPDDYDSEESSDDEDGPVTRRAKCAVCFRRDDPSHKWRRLVTLPCCGTGGKENTSTTRFCAACILKVAVTRTDSSNSGEYRPWEDERDEAPVSRFYRENRQSETKRFIECPRCRDILIVKIKGLKTRVTSASDDDSSYDGECDCSECRAERRANRATVTQKTAYSVSLHRGTFKGKAWFVGRKRGMADILWRAAHLHHTYIPLAALGGEKCKGDVLRLVGWGLLRKVPGKKESDVFQLDKKDQAELVKLVSPNPNNETEEELSKENGLLLHLSIDMAFTAKESLMKFRIDQIFRLVNRFMYLFLYINRYLPAPPLPLWTECVVTAFNAFNILLVLQFLLIVAVYAGLLLGVAFTVCYFLRNGKSSSIWWQAALFGYLAFRFSKALYYSAYVSWIGFVAPKAWIPIKKIVWG